MFKKLICINPEEYPVWVQDLIKDAKVYDSSSSPAARVLFIDKDDGYYLKCAEKGSLKTEAKLTEYFHEKKMAQEVLAYEVHDKDYMLTRKVKGEDCTEEKYLSEPKRLAKMLGEILRALHEVDFSDCAFDRVKTYVSSVNEGYESGRFDNGLDDFTRKLTRDDAYRIAKETMPYLKREVLIHGDYCLPNIMLDDWKFSAFIDVGNGGVGDRHIDLFWGLWSLGYNLKTDKFSDWFLDAYGKDKVDFDKLEGISAMECFG